MVSVYDAGEFIENRLDNLRQISIRKDADIWVVNTNSPDPRDHTIPSAFPGINYTRLPERIGVYATWNYIIKHSKSEYLTNANADDLIAPNGYEKLIKTLEITKADFAYPSWYTTDRPNLTWNDIKKGKAAADKSGKPGIFKGNLDTGGVGHFPVWRRKLHDKLGLFDERFKALGDADWWTRCWHLGKANFQWQKEYLACYLFRNGQNLWHRSISDDEWRLYHQKASEYNSTV